MKRRLYGSCRRVVPVQIALLREIGDVVSCLDFLWVSLIYGNSSKRVGKKWRFVGRHKKTAALKTAVEDVYYSVRLCLKVLFYLFYKVGFGLCAYQFVHYFPALYKKYSRNGSNAIVDR